MNDRIRRLREQSLTAVPTISLERAQLLTDFYASGAGERESVPVARAMAFKYLLERMTICVNDGELIVGERGPAPKAAPTYPEICTHSVNDFDILHNREKVSFKVDDVAENLKNQNGFIPGWTLCVNTPYRDWYAGQVREVASLGVDGIFVDGPFFPEGTCYCKYCRESYKKDTGKDHNKDWARQGQCWDEIVNEMWAKHRPKLAAPTDGWKQKHDDTRYRAANPTHGKLSRKEFVHGLQLSANAEAWLSLKSVEYRPFAATDPAKQPAIIVYPSDGSGSGDKVIVFSIGDLIAR